MSAAAHLTAEDLKMLREAKWEPEAGITPSLWGDPLLCCILFPLAPQPSKWEVISTPPAKL